MSDKVYNLSQLEELAGGNEEFVNSMVETFLEHTPSQLQEMLNAYSENDMNLLGSIAHKIKPNIDLFEISAIHGEIRVVEEKGKNGIKDSELEQSLKKVEKVLEESFNQLRQR